MGYRNGKLCFLCLWSFSINIYISQVSDNISEGILEDIEVNVTSVGLVVRHPGAQYPGLIEEVNHAALYDTITLLRKITESAKEDGVGLLTGQAVKSYIEKVSTRGMSCRMLWI